MKASALAARVRRSLVALPPPLDNIKAVVPPLPPDALVPGDLRLHGEAQKALGRINGFIQSQPRQRFLVTRLLERQEAVHSSAIEGTSATLADLLATDNDDEVANEELQQVRQYAVILAATISEVRDRGIGAIDMRTLKKLHRAVLEADPRAELWRGRLRDAPVRISGRSFETATFIPPPPDRLVSCLRQHFRWLRDDEIRFKNSSIARIACAHAHFEAIHPFTDGNGRVGRLLMALMLAAEGDEPLYLSPYIDANKDHYYAALRAAQQRDDWGAMIDFISMATIATVDETLRVHDRLSGLITDWRAHFQPRSGSVLDRLLDLLPDYPSLSVKLAAKKLGVTYPAVSNAIELLHKEGILVETTGQARNRRFVADAIVALFQPNRD